MGEDIPVEEAAVAAWEGGNSAVSLYNCSMKRIVVFVFVMALSAIMLPSNAVFAEVNDYYFESGVFDYYLTKSEDNTSIMHVKEVLTAVFPETDQNHGITRMIPYTNQGGTNKTVANKTVLNLSVLRNGKPENIDKVVTEGGYYTVYIGSASDYVHGKQIYTLEYDYTDVITEFTESGKNVSGAENAEKAFQELYWNTNGTEWKQRFGKVTANLHTSMDVYEKMDKHAWCYVGDYGTNDEGKCAISPTNDGFSFTAKDLAARENLTFATRFDPNTFKVIIRKDYTLVLIIAVETLLAVILIAWQVLKWVKDAKPKYNIYKNIFVAPQYQPPKDGNIHVAEGEQVYIKKTGSSYVATLLELAVAKKITIKKMGDAKPDWTVILNVEPSELADSQKQVMNILSGDGKFKKGDEIPIEKHIATAYLSNCAKDYEENAIEALEKGGYLVEKRKKKKANWLAIIFCLVLMLAMFFCVEFLDDFMKEYSAYVGEAMAGGKYMIYIPPIIMIVTFMLALKISQKRHKYAKYTEEGLRLARYLEGLELYIKMAEAERLKILQSVKGADTSNAGIIKLYEKLLPWASLFGAEKSWAKELEKYYRVEDIDRTIGSDVLNGIIAANILNDINGTIVASSGYSSSSSSSSGGGGGGFSGGGGGGGGGGGW